ncbi:hypothetical protein Hanom_Chr13g01218251 [Helianthus anomalus]
MNHIEDNPVKEKSRALAVNCNDFLPYENQIGSAFMAEQKRWDPDRECYLDPQGNVCTNPKAINFDALVTSIPTEAEDIQKEKERKEKAEKIAMGIIDVNGEMIAEILKKMVDQVLMAKALEVDTESASESELSSKVSSVSPNVELGKAQETKSEGDCRNCMKPCKSVIHMSFC